MNWYKTAKLIDKRHHTETSEVTIKCMYCHRWATHPENEKTDRDSYVWKKDEELDQEEHVLAGQSLLSSNVSSAICPKCYKILQDHNNHIDPNKVKELSLKETYETYN